jgi:hypothetical protein
MSQEIQDENKIKIQWDDLKTRKVDQRLKEQEAVERNRRQAELNLLVSVATAPVRTSVWNNSIFVMAFFGIIGGVLAWGGGELLRFPDPRYQAETGLRQIQDFVRREALGEPGAARAIKNLIEENKDNPYFKVEIEEKPAAEKDADRAAVDKQQQMKRFISILVSMGISGMLIAASLAAAEKLVDRNYSQAIVNGIVGAALGLVGGAVVSLFFAKILNSLRGGGSGADAASSRILAYAVAYGVLGLFLTIAPGIMMRNGKKLVIGMLGGIVGGLIGGAIYDPIFSVTDGSDMIGRLVALLAIGLFAGLGTGLIENAAKNGWLKVTAGLIAGKQFILYRNPTFIGSGPECPIYLFRDPQVGKRHAAIHIVPGGFELENLPMGGDTLLNGKPVTRTRLRTGDAIQVGATAFAFQEKVRTK